MDAGTHTFLITVGITIAPYVGIFIVGIASYFGLDFFAKKPERTGRAIAALQMLKIILVQRLGDRGNAVFDTVLEGLKSVQDGKYTDEEKIELIKNFLRAAVGTKIELNDHELADAQAATALSLKSVPSDAKATKAAIRSLSIDK